MFDPTIFDNLKVALENELYDLDNLDQAVHITNRIDRLELSTMSRVFMLRFELTGEKRISAELELTASMQELAAEILELSGENPGCLLCLRYIMQMKDTVLCSEVERIMAEMWPEQKTVQQISYVYGSESMMTNTVEINFNRKINENHMRDMPELVRYMMEAAKRLGEVMELQQDE